MNSKEAALRRIKQLHVHSTQGYSGVLMRESRFVFNYVKVQPDAEISLTMLLRAESYAANVLPGVLQQNLPEGYLPHRLYKNFGKTVKMDDFNIPALIGKGMIGRVRCSLEADSATSPPEPEDLKAYLRMWYLPSPGYQH